MSLFSHDPEIKREAIWHGPVYRPASALVEPRGPVVSVRAEHGKMTRIATRLAGPTACYCTSRPGTRARGPGAA